MVISIRHADISDAEDVARRTRQLGYANLKTQHSFARSVSGGPDNLGALVPRVEH